MNSPQPHDTASAPRVVLGAPVRPLTADITRPATQFDPELTYYAGGTHVVMRAARRPELTGRTVGITDAGLASYCFQVVAWVEGGVDLVAPHVLHRVRPEETG